MVKKSKKSQLSRTTRTTLRAAQAAKHHEHKGDRGIEFFYLQAEVENEQLPVVTPTDGIRHSSHCRAIHMNMKVIGPEGTSSVQETERQRPKEFLASLYYCVMFAFSVVAFSCPHDINCVY